MFSNKFSIKIAVRPAISPSGSIRTRMLLCTSENAIIQQMAKEQSQSRQLFMQFSKSKIN